jgi:hypothetical protein
MYMPYLAYYSGPGAPIGITYVARDNASGKAVATAQPVASLQPDASITFVPAFTPVKGHTYSVTATANEPNGHTETRTSLVTVS